MVFSNNNRSLRGKQLLPNIKDEWVWENKTVHYVLPEILVSTRIDLELQGFRVMYGEDISPIETASMEAEKNECILYRVLEKNRFKKDQDSIWRLAGFPEIAVIVVNPERIKVYAPPRWSWQNIPCNKEALESWVETLGEYLNPFKGCQNE